MSNQNVSHLFLGEVELAQLLPQLPVLTEHVQCGRGLAQVYDVTSIAEFVQDVVLHVQREVAQGRATAGHLLQSQ